MHDPIVFDNLVTMLGPNRKGYLAKLYMIKVHLSPYFGVSNRPLGPATETVVAKNSRPLRPAAKIVVENSKPLGTAAKLVAEIKLAFRASCQNSCGKQQAFRDSCRISC